MESGLTPLGELLVQAGRLTSRDLERALQAQQQMGGLLGQVLVRLGLVSDLEVVRILSKQLDIPFLDGNDFPVLMPEVPGIQLDFLISHGIYPIRLDNEVLQVAMAVPQDQFIKKALKLSTGLNIQAFIATEQSIERALNSPVADPTEKFVDIDDNVFEGNGGFVEHLKDLASEAPVIRLVNSIVGRVVDLRASDIHLEPFDDGLHVRYRVDGILLPEEIVSPKHSAAVNSRVKLLAHLDIAERRLPQDGRIKMRIKGRELDLRVSTIPTVYGESVVMRVLDRSTIRFSLEDMGFASDTLVRFNSLLLRPHGILLVTGPTGSGKTTTLYAALSKLDSNAQKIITVEDPVEYQLEGINQIQVHGGIGLDFAHALRSILRQDPDIIMIGEMRDGETAQIAVQSALTGHLVLSTLHTNTAAGAVVRMRDMGVEGYLITSSVNGVLAQRLVRTLCQVCRQSYQPEIQDCHHWGLDKYLTSAQPIYQAVGCSECHGTGYRGRTGIHELLILDESIRRAIIEGQDATQLDSMAIRSGMVSMYQDGLRKVAAGLTTVEEVLRIAQEAEIA